MPGQKTKKGKDGFPANLSKQEREDFYRVFCFYDKRKDGKLSKGEMDMMLKSLGLQLNAKEFNDLFVATDVNKTGAIDFKEFVNAFCSKRRLPTSLELQDAFKEMDRNGDGWLTKDELKLGMSKVGQPISDEGLNSLIALFDKNKDGRISYGEFTLFLKG